MAAMDDHDIALQQVLNESRSDLEEVRKSPENSAWLGPNLSTSEGTEKVYKLLEKVVESPAFLDKISQLCHCEGDNVHNETSDPHGQRGAHVPPEDGEVLHSDWWNVESSAPTQAAEPLPEGEAQITPSSSEAMPVPCVGLDQEGYVLVEKEDVIDALAVFIARYVVSLPESRDMEPKAVQRAVANAFVELRMGPIRRMWDWGKCVHTNPLGTSRMGWDFPMLMCDVLNLYRCAALGYSAFSMYQNPWIIAAVLRAVYTSSKVVLALF